MAHPTFHCSTLNFSVSEFPQRIIDLRNNDTARTAAKTMLTTMRFAKKVEILLAYCSFLLLLPYCLAVLCVFQEEDVVDLSCSNVVRFSALVTLTVSLLGSGAYGST